MIIPPLPTPFDAKGNLDAAAFAELAQALEPQVDGLLFYGSNGEGVHLSNTEREKGLKAQQPSKPCGMGLMEETIPAGLEALAQANMVAARYVLVTPPRYYNANLSAEGLASYYTVLAGAAGPEVWLYHVPQNTKAELPLPLVAELAKHPRITGLKDSSGELSRMAFYRAAGVGLEVFTGHAPTFLGSLALGAKGGILAAANLAPKGYRAILSAWKEGNSSEALRLHCQLEPLGRILAQGGFVLLKQALRYLGLPGGYPRPPYPHESPHWAGFRPVLDKLKYDGLLVTG
ncbi:MAG: dihydrodipicolinate synthase family protein [Deinococcus sp.]|nr:dihydrodipicolinate synthase family protein [Deinococcus sp.]